MTLSIWRYAHLAFAMIASLFLLLVAVTGIILGIDAFYESKHAYAAKEFEKISFVQSLTELHKTYPEITGITIDYNHQVIIDGVGIVDPLSGKFLGKPREKGEFIQWVTAFHRSLFLHNTGRAIIGIVSFLLLIIVLSGVMLIIRRHQGFFFRIGRGEYHVQAGRILLIPLLLIALSGAYLSLARFGLLNTKPLKNEDLPQVSATRKELSQFPAFSHLYLSQVKEIEFPFDTEDPEEYYILKLMDAEIKVNQFTGEIVQKDTYPFTAVMETLSLDIHTGRTNPLWAIVLAFAAANIPGFIYSGFAITFGRRAVHVKNSCNAADSAYELLVGSENGSTLHFAGKIHEQLLAVGKTAYLAELNSFKAFPAARHIIVFTSTFGMGESPSNASKIQTLLDIHMQDQKINFSIAKKREKTLWFVFF